MKKEEKLSFSNEERTEIIKDLIEIIENLPYPPIKFIANTDKSGDEMEVNVYEFVGSRWKAIKSLKKILKDGVGGCKTYETYAILSIIKEIKKYVTNKEI